LCQEEVNSPTSANASRLSHARCGVQSFTSCAVAFHDGEEILRGASKDSYLCADTAKYAQR